MSGSEAVTGNPAVPAAPSAAGTALDLRDQALAALDGGDPQAALGLARDGLALLAGAGQDGGPDEAALLVALAEIEESLGRFGDAADTIATAITLLGGDIASAGDDGDLLLWCQAQERQAGLERLAGDFAPAAARLVAVLDVAAAEFGEASSAVLSAANALGVVYKYAADFDAAEAAYQRALAAADAMARAEGAGGTDAPAAADARDGAEGAGGTDADAMDGADPLILAGLLHNLGGLAHSRGDAATGIPLAERGLALRTEVLGDSHPEVAQDLNALGALYQLAGRFADADRAYQRALAIFEDTYGRCHLEVAHACANLAALRADEGDFQAAESLGHRALRIFEAILGPDDAEVGLTMLNMATAIAGQGRLGDGAALAARADAILATRLPAGHPHVMAARETLDHLRGLGG
jgi:tetratricopeptide (TPR) repeat protein